MAIPQIAAPVAPPIASPGYIETALHWLIEKINAVVYFIFSCFCSSKSLDLSPPAGAIAAAPPAVAAAAPPPVAAVAAPAAPVLPAPLATFDSLSPDDQRRRCAETLQYFQDTAVELRGVYNAIGRQEYRRKLLSLDWFRSYESIGRREVRKNPLLVSQHALPAVRALLNTAEV